VKYFSTSLLLLVGFLAACSRTEAPTNFRGEFEVYRFDGAGETYAVILYENGKVVSSQRGNGLGDLQGAWSEENGVIHLTGWNVSGFVSASPEFSEAFADEIIFHRREKEGSQILVTADSIDAFDAGDFAKSWIYWKAGPDAVVGYKTYWNKDEEGVHYVGKRFDNPSLR